MINHNKQYTFCAQVHFKFADLKNMDLVISSTLNNATVLYGIFHSGFE